METLGDRLRALTIGNQEAEVEEVTFARVISRLESLVLAVANHTQHSLTRAAKLGDKSVEFEAPFFPGIELSEEDIDTLKRAVDKVLKDWSTEHRISARTDLTGPFSLFPVGTTFYSVTVVITW